MRNVCLIVLLSGLWAIQAVSQTPRNPAIPQPSTPSKSVGAEGKIACLNFADFREGIVEMKTVMDAVVAEFEPKRLEVKDMGEKLDRLKLKLQSADASITPATRLQWSEEIAEQEKQIQRKSEDYSQQGQKRMAEATQPIYDKILKFLEVYCQKHGIVIAIEFGNAVQSGTLIWRAPSADITADFMKEFNKVNTVGTKTP